MQDNIAEIQEKFKKTDERMHQMQNDIEFFESFLSRYAEAVKNIAEVEEFYFSDSYMQEMEILRNDNLDQYWSTSEDGIWNLGIEYRSVRIKLLKMLTDSIYNETLRIDK